MSKQRNHKTGFTLIEVLLFLAISALIITVLMFAVASSVARQRYNDSVQDFTEFLRRQYAETIVTVNNRPVDDLTCTRYFSARASLLANETRLFPNGLPGNIQISNNILTDPNKDSDGRGKSDCNIYGRLILIGQGDPTTPSEPGEGTEVHTYTVIGADLDPEDIRNQNISNLGAFLLTVPVLLDGNCGIGTGSSHKVYNLPWVATTEKVDKSILRTAILILRNPISGTVHTLISKQDESTDYVNKLANSFTTIDNTTCAYSEGGYNLWQVLGNENVTFDQDLDICVGSYDVYANANKRRMIRVTGDSRNGTGVELIPQDSEENLCN